MSAATTKEPNGALQLLVATASAYGVYKIYAYYVNKQSHRAGKTLYLDPDETSYRFAGRRKHSKEKDQQQGRSSPTTRTRGMNKKSSRSREKQSGSFSSDTNPTTTSSPEDATTPAADEDLTTTNQEIDDNGDPINENQVDLIGQFYWDKLSEKARLLLEQQMLIQESFIPGFIQDAKDRLRVQDYQNAKKAVLEKKKLEKMLKKLEFRYHLVLTCLTDLDIAYCKRKLALDVSKSTLLRLELDELVESKIADCRRKYFGGNNRVGSGFLVGGMAGSSGFSSPSSSKASTRNNYQLAATASSLYPSLEEPRKHNGNHVFQQQSPQFPLRSSPEGENFHSGRFQQQQQQQHHQQWSSNSTRNNMSLVLSADDIPNEFDDFFVDEDGSFLLEQPRAKPPTPVNIAYYPEGAGGPRTSRGGPLRGSFFRRTRETTPASFTPGINNISAAGRPSPGAGTMLTSSVHHAGTSDTKSSKPDVLFHQPLVDFDLCLSESDSTALETTEISTSLYPELEPPRLFSSNGFLFGLTATRSSTSSATTWNRSNSRPTPAPVKKVLFAAPGVTYREVVRRPREAEDGVEGAGEVEEENRNPPLPLGKKATVVSKAKSVLKKSSSITSLSEGPESSGRSQSPFVGRNSCGSSGRWGQQRGRCASSSTSSRVEDCSPAAMLNSRRSGSSSAVERTTPSRSARGRRGASVDGKTAPNSAPSSPAQEDHGRGRRSSVTAMRERFTSGRRVSSAIRSSLPKNNAPVTPPLSTSQRSSSTRTSKDGVWKS